MTTTPFRKLDDAISVAGQIQPSDVAEAAAAGYRLIINNRPEGEEPGQPAAADIEAAAQAAGLSYVAIPVSPAGMRPDQVDAMKAALEAADGPALAFCRSGTRSTYLWALSRAELGDAPAELVEKADAQGYNVRPLFG
ncbi:TIGR01244 family sulfur transferase [Sphingomonas sp. BIUV-7]|uniref:TIGR01244 family sulfur transferase n=1 Tax=Sphingomonas natans TaxID=3063330 RepID=A0ABT8YAV6_9SPHN|nr:TIGR01244 family sulfur transferase [Sphingomonas sp. BIUV-7]MDO6415474.1 TIGR01244 family sulfur transferase [Sphingomonas sp. BIUV-7]